MVLCWEARLLACGLWGIPVTVLSFTVEGKAEPQGSARAFMPKAGGRFPIVTSDNPKLKGWRKAVSFSAMDAMASAGKSMFPFQDGPVTLTVDFYLPRPATLKAYAAHLGRPDVDKLARAVGDALTGIVYADDSQIDMLVVRKGYAAPGTLPRAEIVVHATTGGLTW